MKKRLILFAALSFAFLTACKDTPKEEGTTAPIETNDAAPVDEHAGHNHGPEGNSHGNNGGSTAGLNPEHGQPGHRCDIPVGTPLDTPVQSGNNAMPVSNAAPQASGSSEGPFLVNDAAKQRIQQEGGTTIAAPSGTGNVNPPHGQPGHRCDLAVGAPL
ncbi:MAG: hypothetical protein LBI72_08270 [Flavobacteriaceae bacterium]|jgi:hypothetical protein|nr:hypothetical protein [Flavobacteriaceae bacterium]